MRRWVLRILVCLILGAISTVAVAWGIAYWVDTVARTTRIDGFLSASTPTWWIAKHETDASIRLWSHVLNKPSRGIDDQYFLGNSVDRPSWSRTNWSPSDVTTRPEVERFEEAAGWPLLALRCSFDYSLPIHEYVDFDFTIRLQDWPDRGPFPSRDESTIRVLPLRPIWPGFLIDTLFYAAIWFGLFFGFTSAKRSMRVKRGRCPCCGYDLRGNLETGCPECGTGRSTD